MVMASEQLPVGAKRPQQELFKQQVLKTKLCKFYAINQCRYGDQCSFAHGSAKLEEMPDLKKTSICKEWRHGTCPLSSIDCPFAHGRNELRRTEIYMHKANGFGNRNSLNNAKLEANAFGNRNLFDNGKLEVDPFEALSAESTSSGDVTIDAEPIKVGTMDSLISTSTRCSSAMSMINIEPMKVATAPSLQCYGGPSVTIHNLPLKYSKKMLTSEFKDMGFELPRDIVYIHLPIDVNTQMNYGHCLIVFTGTHALNAFMETFQGKVLRQFKAERKAVMLICTSSHGFDATSPTSTNSDFINDKETTLMSELVSMDRQIWEQNSTMRHPECRACTGCGHINMVIDHRFCKWCGCSLSDMSPSVAKDHVGGSWQ